MLALPSQLCPSPAALLAPPAPPMPLPAPLLHCPLPPNFLPPLRPTRTQQGGEIKEKESLLHAKCATWMLERRKPSCPSGSSDGGLYFVPATTLPARPYGMLPSRPPPLPLLSFPIQSSLAHQPGLALDPPHARWSSKLVSYFSWVMALCRCSLLRHACAYQRNSCSSSSSPLSAGHGEWGLCRRCHQN